MNTALTTSLFPFMKAQASAGGLASQEGDVPEPRRRAQPPQKWSFRVDLPLVREAMRYTDGHVIKVRTPQEIAALCADLRDAAQEAFVVVDLNAKNNVIDKRLVSLGILDASLVHPREVFRGALQNSAAAVVLCHNHPSGEPTPSAEDIRITRQLVEAGRILDIRVLDHIVIGRPDTTAPGSPAFTSIREAGLVQFNT